MGESKNLFRNDFAISIFLSTEIFARLCGNDILTQCCDAYEKLANWLFEPFRDDKWQYFLC